jgi:hypothetical protein
MSAMRVLSGKRRSLRPRFPMRQIATSALFACSAGACLFPDYRIVDDSLPDAGPPGGSTGDGAARESCSNGIDDDADGRKDCFDSDCRDDAACAGKCSDAESLPCDAVLKDQSTLLPGATQRIAPPSYGCNGKSLPGPEYAYRFTGPADKDVFVELYETGSDLSVFVIDVTAGEPCDAANACLVAGAAASGNLPEAVAFTRAAGHEYYVVVDGSDSASFALSVQCSTVGGCSPARAIQAGQTLSASNELGSGPNVTQKLETYSCAGGAHTAPEAAFMFTPTLTASYRIDLTNFSSNLNLFVVAAPNCSSLCLSPTSASTGPGGTESVVLDASAGTTYYIVVDGFATSVFDLTVTEL